MRYRKHGLALALLLFSAVSSPAHGEQGFSHSSAGDGVGSVEARIRL